MIFFLFKTKIYISFFFCVSLLLFSLIDKSGLVLPVLLASLLHEIGHIVALFIVKNPPNEINFIVGGIEIKTNTAKNNIFVSLSGPLFNIFLFCVFYFIDINFSAINFLLGGFNLLPLLGLDGATVLCEIFKNNKTEKVITVLTILFSAFLFIVAIFIKTTDNKASFLLLSLYFMLFALLKYS